MMPVVTGPQTLQYKFRTNIDEFRRDLRKNALYWDQIDWPLNVAGVIEHGDSDSELLKKEGIYRRTEVGFFDDGVLINPGGEGQAFVEFDTKSSSVINGQLAVMMFHNLNNEGQWSIAQSGPDLRLPPGTAVHKKTAEVELYRVVPVPALEVPMDKVLEFKLRRRTALLEFRGAMDDLYLDVVNSGDFMTAQNRAVEKLKQAILGVHRVMKESKLKRLLSTMKVELNAGDVVAGYATGTALAQTGLPELASLSAGLAGAMIKLGVRVVPQIRNIPQNLQAYAVLHHVEKELSRERS